METFSQVLVDAEDIVKLIPHREPFVMVDKLLYYDEQKTISSFLVRPDNIFSYNGFLAEPALIENIAQTAALRVGYPIFLEYKSGKTHSAHLGFIGAISKLKIFQLPPVGAELTTEVLFVNEVMDIILISGSVSHGENKLAECEMKIFIKRK